MHLDYDLSAGELFFPICNQSGAQDGIFSLGYFHQARCNFHQFCFTFTLFTIYFCLENTYSEIQEVPAFCDFVINPKLSPNVFISLLFEPFFMKL